MLELKFRVMLNLLFFASFTIGMGLVCLKGLRLTVWLTIICLLCYLGLFHLLYVFDGVLLYLFTKLEITLSYLSRIDAGFQIP